MNGVSDGEDHVDLIQSQWRRERPDVDVSPQGVIGRLHRLALALTEELVEVYRDFGLSEGEFDLLCALRRSGEPFECQPSELARLTMVTTGGTTKRIDRLEASGFVVRSTANSPDARAKRIRLTDRGRHLIDEAFTAHMANEVRLAAMLSVHDRETLEPILKTWLACL
ncbi:transcriptional regulator [Humibacillus sp. DSM 29435]|nr:MarR family transcriptional regulator [Humibacillus sp. DSM 29435]OFE15554.1 transcriptional regulator [Humibacillus sp. DSM 29435]